MSCRSANGSHCMAIRSLQRGMPTMRGFPVLGTRLTSPGESIVSA